MLEKIPRGLIGIVAGLVLSGCGGSGVPAAAAPSVMVEAAEVSGGQVVQGAEALLGRPFLLVVEVQDVTVAEVGTVGAVRWHTLDGQLVGWLFVPVNSSLSLVTSGVRLRLSLSLDSVMSGTSGQPGKTNTLWNRNVLWVGRPGRIELLVPAGVGASGESVS